MEPLLNKPSPMVTLSVQSFLVEWWGDMSWDSIHQNFVSMGMSGPIILRERVKSMIDDCISRRFPSCKEMTNYNIWKDNVSSNFVGQMPDVVSKVHRKFTHGWTLEKLETQKFNSDRWRVEIPQLSRRRKTHVKNLNRVDRHVIPGGGAFLFAWRDVVIEKHERLGRGSYGVVWKCFIKDISDVDPFTPYAIKFFLDHNGSPHMASMKEFYSVASIDHGGVIKPFAFQTTPAPAIFLPYWNGGTLGDMFKSMKDHGTNEYDVFQRLTILKKNHPEQISKIQELERLRLFLLNRCTLAITFIQIMADVLTIHNVFHCDLSFTNILFHFGEMDDKDEIYIGIGDWGSATISSDRRHSNHFLQSESLRHSRLQERWWVDPELFFTKDHNARPCHTEKTESYSVSKIAEAIWGLYVDPIYLKVIHSRSYNLLLHCIRRMSCTSTTELRMTPTDVMNRLSREPDFHTFPFNKHIRQRYLSLPERNRVHSRQIDCDDEIPFKRRK